MPDIIFVCEMPLTQDIQALGSWRKAGLCSIHCKATLLWSAGSCNRHSCTGGSFHALKTVRWRQKLFMKQKI